MKTIDDKLVSIRRQIIGPIHITTHKRGFVSKYILHFGSYYFGLGQAPAFGEHWCFVYGKK